MVNVMNSTTSNSLQELFVQAVNELSSIQDLQAANSHAEKMKPFDDAAQADPFDY